MFLGLWNSPSYGKYQHQIMGYINNLLPFMKRYCQERYDITIGNVEAGWPYWTPKSYEEIRAFDMQIHQAYFEDTIQIYVAYGFDLIPHPPTNHAGYCEARRGPIINPEDMLYVEMYPFLGTSLFIRSIYHYYAEFSRRLTHELDHRMLAYLDSPLWIRGPHEVAQRPDKTWVMDNGARFYSQNDPR